MSFQLVIFFILIVAALFLFGALMVYYRLRRQWFDHQFENRKIRQKHYHLLIHEISEAAARGDEEGYQKLAAQMDSLLTIVSPVIVSKLSEFQKFIRSGNIRVLKNSEFWLEQRDELSRDLILSLREDIYGYEPEAVASLSQWKPLSRTIRKPGTRPLEVITFKLAASRQADSGFRRQK